MGQSENQTFANTVATSKARIFSIWAFAPLKDVTAKIAQALWLNYDTNLSSTDRAAIDLFYASRKSIHSITPEVVSPQPTIDYAINWMEVKNISDGNNRVPAANDESYKIAA